MVATLSRRALACAALLTGGCLGGGDSIDPDETGSRGESIRHPDDISVDGSPGIVQRTNGCTGTMIGPRLIVTAGHCVNPTTTPTPFPLVYFEPGLPADSPRSLGSPNVLIYRNPDYAVGVDDTAIVVLAEGDRWLGTDYHDYRRVFQDNGSLLPSSMEFLGAGDQSFAGGDRGTLNQWSFSRTDWNSDLMKFAMSSDIGVCTGDSGGPFVEPNFGFITCIQSRVDSGLVNDKCAVDGNAVCTRTVWSNLGEIVATNTSEPSFSFNNGFYSYTRFFDIPFINDVPGEGLDQDLATALAVTAL